MELSLLQISTLFESFKHAKLQNELSTKIDRLLNDFKKLLTNEPCKQKTEVSVEVINRFLQKFSSADSIGKIQRSKNPPNLIFWNALGFGKDEVTNCRVLHWLLDPHADHCQGNRFLSCLLQQKKLEQYSDYANRCVYVSREEWIDETNRADIVIHGESFNIVIEVKIMAPERKNQRVDYRSRMLKCYPDKKFLGIFLTWSNNYSEEIGWISLTWNDVVSAITMFTNSDNKNSCNSLFVKELTSQYRKYLINNLIDGKGA